MYGIKRRRANEYRRMAGGAKGMQQGMSARVTPHLGRKPGAESEFLQKGSGPSYCRKVHSGMYELQFEGMTCGGCVKGVTLSVQTVDGNAKVDVDLKSKKVRIRHD